MKLLVTGADGFIGEHVVRIAEERGHEVWCIDKKSGGEMSEYNTSSFIEYDAVIHLAALIDIKESFEKPWLYTKNNLLPINLLSNARRVVFASSAAVYGDPSPYGLTKMLGEFLLPKNSVSLRLFNPFGPGENHNPETHIIPIIAEKRLSREAVTLFQEGKQVRSFIHVEDAATAFVLAAESSITGTYDLCDTNLSIKEVADLMGADYILEKRTRDDGDTDKLTGSCWQLQEALQWEPMHDVKKELRHWRDWYGK